MIKDFNKKLDLVFPNPKCELNYNKDYELLIATMLSAQCTDKRVNEVTSILFNKYDSNMTIEPIKLRANKNEKLYKVSYKFKLI